MPLFLSTSSLSSSEGERWIHDKALYLWRKESRKNAKTDAEDEEEENRSYKRLSCSIGAKLRPSDVCEARQLLPG